MRNMTAIALAGLLAAPSVHAFSFDVGDTEVTFGAYVKIDANVTDRGTDGNVNEAFMVPALIPLDDAHDSNNTLRLSARETRFNVRTTTPTRLGNLVTFIEIDFLDSRELPRQRLVGNQAPRLRHAFGSLGPWLVGQTWGTFYNVTTKPETLDFVGPVGTLFNRNIQVRYTHDLGDGQNVMLAAEQPFTTLSTNDEFDPDANEPANVRTGTDDRFPDLVARYNVSGGWGHGSIAGVVRNLRADRSTSSTLDVDADDDKWGGAVSVTGTVNLWGMNDFRFQLNAGNALGRYIALNAFDDGYIDADGKIDDTTIYGGYAAYRHWWTQRTRSNFVYSYVEADNPSDARESANEKFHSVHVNIITTPIERVDIGLEYIYAKRNIEGRVESDTRSGTVSSGDIHRVQASAKYAF